MSRRSTTPTTSRVAPHRWLGSLAIAVALAACSLPVGEEIEPLDVEEYSDVVYGLDTTTTTEPQAGTQIRLYFASDRGLERVFRPFLAEPTIPEILTALQDGPTESEQAENPTLRTELPAGLNPNPRTREEGQETVIVEVSDEGGLRLLINDNPVKADLVLTQLVCTLTKLNLLSGIPITGVEFHDSQGRIPIVDANRASIEGPARASDFNDCVTQDELDAMAEEAENEDPGDGSTSTTGG
ncbi:MAG: GerMN domain-containing protein [Acidimicrobiia bacterium]|nr:GerMN domain-containing protein [Acidimicrobiia bacterium]